MRLSIEKTQTHGGRRFGAIGMNRRLARPAWWAVTCAAMLASDATAQSCGKPSSDEPSWADRQTAGNAARQAIRDPALDPGLIPVLEADGIVFDDDDQEARPRWYCFDTNVELDPVWQGNPLAHSFEICNLGNVDLRIHAKGG